MPRRGQRIPLPAGGEAADIQPPARAPAVGGALVTPSRLRLEKESAYGGLGTDGFDYRIILAVPPSGTLGFVLVGPNVLGFATPTPGAMPFGYRGAITGFSPYLEGGVGPVAGPRIVGAGVAIVWHLLFSSKPAPVFNEVTQLLDPWGYESPFPLVELPEGALIGVTVDYTDPGALYSRIGVRVRGYWEPWQRDAGEVRDGKGEIH